MSTGNPSIVSSLMTEEEPVLKIKSETKQKDAAEARRAGAKTATEKALDDTIRQQGQLLGKKDQLMKANKAVDNINGLMDKVGLLSPKQIFSEDTFMAVKRLIPNMTREDYMNTFAPNVVRRRKLTQQLEAIPIGTQLPKQTLQQLKAVGITEPAKYMSLTTKAPANTLIGAFERVAEGIARGGDTASPFFAAGKQIQMDEDAIAKVREKILVSEMSVSKASKSGLKMVDQITDPDGTPNPKGTHISKFTVDENGQIDKLVSVSKSSEYGGHELKMLRQENLTEEQKVRLENANKLKADYDKMMRDRNVAEAKLKDINTRVNNLRTKDIPKLNKEMTNLLPIQAQFTKMSQLVKLLSDSGKMGPVKGRIVGWKNKFLPTDPLVAKFKAIVEPIGGYTARQLYEILGAQTEKDEQRIRHAVPMLHGTAAWNQAVIDEVLNMAMNRKAAIQKQIDFITELSDSLEFAASPRYKTVEELEKAGLPRGSTAYLFDEGKGKWRKVRVD